MRCESRDFSPPTPLFSPRFHANLALNPAALPPPQVLDVKGGVANLQAAVVDRMCASPRPLDCNDGECVCARVSASRHHEQCDDIF